jgi:hypothetical protein
MNSNKWFFIPPFFTKMTSKIHKTFYGDKTNEDEFILQKTTYIAFTILKLKFTKLGYFLRLSNFLRYKTTVQKLNKMPNIFKMR